MGRKNASEEVSMVSVEAGGGGEDKALSWKHGGEGHRHKRAKPCSSHPACTSNLFNAHSGIHPTPFILECVRI